MDKTFPVVLELDVPKDPGDIFSFTKAVMQQVMNFRELDLATQRRIKMILIELVTNSIKHSGQSDSQIRLVVDEPSLTIQKKEKGVQIEFMSSEQQIPFEEIDKTIKISFSTENKHHVKTLDRYKFRFLDPFKEGLNLEHMPEHFGFYIITLASDSFVYQYDPEKKENHYIVNINT